MKRIIALVLVLISISTVFALAEAFDWASMSDEELRSAFNSIQMELNKRKKLAEQQESIMVKDGAVLLDHNGLTITVEGMPWFVDYGERQYIYFTAVAVNNTNKDYALDFDDCSVNTWESNAYGFGMVSAGKKKRTDCYIYATDARIKSLDEIEECMMCVKVMDEKYRLVYKSETTNYMFVDKH